jgi:hypothetical protein
MELVKEYLPPHVTPITDIFFWAADSCSVADGLGAAIRPETVPYPESQIVRPLVDPISHGADPESEQSCTDTNQVCFYSRQSGSHLKVEGGS